MNAGIATSAGGAGSTGPVGTAAFGTCSAYAAVCFAGAAAGLGAGVAAAFGAAGAADTPADPESVRDGSAFNVSADGALAGLSAAA